MKKHFKPILFLFAVSLIFTELLTGNMSIVEFINPIIFIMVVIAGYGLPILLIREYAIRWNLGIVGLFLMGLAYGIYNEGLMAKTILLTENVPIENFDGYVTILGVNIAWAVLIVVWHALNAVIYPILLTWYFYPNQYKEVWLSTKVKNGISIFLIIVASLLFFGEEANGVVGTIPHFILFVISMAVLILLAKMSTGKVMIETTVSQQRIKQVFFGGLFLVLFLLVSAILAQNNIPAAVIIAFIGLLIVWVYKVFQKKKLFTVSNILTFGIGSYMAQTSLGIIWVPDPVRIITMIIILIILAILLRKIFKDGEGKLVEGR